MEPQIIYDNDDFFILDKPADWVVNTSESAKSQHVIQEWLKLRLYPLAANDDLRSGIVHRLDKPTSGILIVAKNSDAFFKLQSQFKQRLVEKKYLALVHGELSQSEGEIDAPVGRQSWNRKRFGVVPGGRESKTLFKVTEVIKSKYGTFSLVKFFPKTGRTHQIRVHAKFIGHPIVSDDLYAGRKNARKDKLFCPRLFLHATQIRFFHPESNKPLIFESKLPEDLRDAINMIKT